MKISYLSSYLSFSVILATIPRQHAHVPMGAVDGTMDPLEPEQI